jgi:uncharacterized protein (DUF1800 family)
MPFHTLIKGIGWSLLLGGSLAHGAVTVTLTPSSATLRVGSQQKFEAKVDGATTTYSLVWTVNSVIGGNATVGTITGDGLYSTPAVPNSPDNKVTVRVQVMRPPKPPETAPVQIAARSATVNLQNPMPVVSALVPAVIKPGPYVLRILGSGFLPTTKVYINQTLTEFSFVSGGELRVSGAATEQQAGDLLVVKLTNPSPGAVSSALALAEIRTFDQMKTTPAEAHRMLRIASWGPSPASVDRMLALGVPAWLDEQFAQPPSQFPDYLMTKPLEYTQEYAYKLALEGPDQLRQRVAFALHQIWVVSGVEVDCAEAYIPYYRILLNRAFGNYYDLMKDMALNVAMGEYLDMVNNAKAASGRLPNENWARELMQLFTIGLVKLNLDGTPVTDAAGNPVPTYGQDEVMAVTRAFTGWTYPDKRPGNPTALNPPYYVGPMEPVQSLHDTGEKILLDGYRLPAGQSAEKDLEDTLQHIFRHPNVGPFVSRQLIQRLVTSNPSSAYIGRVAAVFNNNGQGVRGDLKAVVRAILTDPAASSATMNASQRAAFGKLQEPALFVVSMLRALKARVTDHPFVADLSSEMGQRVFYSPSVFNYFSPNYRIPGTTLFGPEFQVLSAATAMNRANFAATLVTGGFGSSCKLDLASLRALADEPPKLIDRVNTILYGGKMPKAMSDQILPAVNTAPSRDEKVQTALYLALATGHYQVDK